MTKKLFYVTVVLVAIGLIGWLTLYKSSGKAGAPSPHTTNRSGNAVPGSNFNKTLHSVDDSDSVWWIVNKTRPLEPATYAPTDLVVPKIPLRLGAGDSEMRLRKETAGALEQMAQAAKVYKINIMLTSGYRSYQLQVAVYNANLQKYGQAGADKQSARPGTSEHQTGLAADLEPTSKKCELEQCFADTPEGQWLATNAYKFGFIIRYPLNKEAITGYEYEPWHLRYVGNELATELHNQNIQTLEEFFNIVPDKQPY